MPIRTKRAMNLLGLSLALACANAMAQDRGCAISDPISGKCMASGNAAVQAAGNGPVHASAPPGQPFSLGGVYESSGYFECGHYDEKTKRCLVRAASAEQRESAVQTGIEAAMSGMRIQREALLRGQQLGLVPASRETGARAPVVLPSEPGRNTNQAVMAKADDFRNCVDAKLDAINQSGRTPSPADQMNAVNQCAP